MVTSKIGRLRHYFWSFINTGGSYFFGIVSSVIIARIASPDDFGTLAIFGIILVICNALSELGFSTTIIRLKYANKKILSTYFWCTLFSSLIVSILYICTIDKIGIIFDNKDISKLGMYLVPTIFFTGLATVPAALMVRWQLFRLKAYMSVTSNLLSVVVGIFIAFYTSPLNGLIVILTVNPLLLNILIIYRIRFGLLPYLNLRYITNRIRFSSGIFMVNLIDHMGRISIISGITLNYGTSLTGIYTRAETVRNLFAYTLDKVVQRVALSELVKRQIKGGGSSFEEHILISKFMIFLLTPISIYVFIHSEQLISILFGSSWTNSSKFLSIISPTIIVIPLTSVNLTFYKATGHSNIAIINKLIFLLGLVTIFIFDVASLELFLKALVFNFYLALLSSIVLLNLVFNYPVAKYVKAIFGYVSMSIIPSVIYLLLIVPLFESSSLNIITTLLIFFCINTFYLYVLKKMRS